MRLLAPIVVFLAFSALLLRLLRSGGIWRLPGLVAFLTGFLAYQLVWAWAMTHPPGLGILPYLQPAMIGLKALAWLEAFALATEKLAPAERRLILYLLASIGAIAAVVVFGSQPDAYHALLAYSAVLLAASALAAVGCFWLAPVNLPAEVRRHGLTLTAFYVVQAALRIVPPTTGRGWMVVNVAYSVGLLCCAWGWWGIASDHRSSSGLVPPRVLDCKQPLPADASKER